MMGKANWRRIWLPLLLLLGTAYVFWILPRQLGVPKLDVQFEPSTPR